MCAWWELRNELEEDIELPAGDRHLLRDDAAFKSDGCFHTIRYHRSADDHRNFSLVDAGGPGRQLRHLRSGGQRHDRPVEQPAVRLPS